MVLTYEIDLLCKEYIDGVKAIMLALVRVSFIVLLVQTVCQYTLVLSRNNKQGFPPDFDKT